MPNGKVIHEWEFNHATAKILEKMLKEQGFNVVMLSDTESDTSIGNRVRKANAENVDMVISIHYNAYQGVWGTHGGIETLHFPSSANGAKLARFVQSELIKATGLRDRGIKPRGDLGILKTRAVAILLECGFMDNRAEADLMLSKKHQTDCARATVNGINRYFGIALKPPVIILPKKEDAIVNTPKSNIPSAWAKESWAWATKEGLLDGKRPHDPISREEVSIILKRLSDSGKLK